MECVGCLRPGLTPLHGSSAHRTGGKRSLEAEQRGQYCLDVWPLKFSCGAGGRVLGATPEET